jgi:hypothetical protein
MARRDLNCPQCGQLFSAQATRCPHCGHRFCRYVDQGRLADLIPVYRRLPKQVRIGIMLFLAFCIVCCCVDVWAQLDKVHHYFHTRTNVPSWLKIKK